MQAKTTIDRAKAIDALSQIRFEPNQDGLMPCFGVMLNQYPASFWNLFTKKMIESAGDSLYNDVAGLLEGAAAECGYHTGWGIIHSEEFKAIIEPMITKKPDDIVFGAFAVFTAWGWGDIEIVDFTPGEGMVLQGKNYYEMDIAKNYSLKKPCAFMTTGVCRAFFDLAYGPAYPNGLNTFKCQQTKGIEVGDPYGEFVVTRWS